MGRGRQLTDAIEAWLRSTRESPLDGTPGFYVPAGQHHCPHCGDTNFEEVTRLCMTCTYPDHPLSYRAYDEAKKAREGEP
jgi:ribosomal protein L37E